MEENLANPQQTYFIEYLFCICVFNVRWAIILPSSKSSALLLNPTADKPGAFGRQKRIATGCHIMTKNTFSTDPSPTRNIRKIASVLSRFISSAFQRTWKPENCQAGTSLP